MKRLPDTGPLTCLITKGELNPENFGKEAEVRLSEICEAADAGVTMVQVREKLLPARLLLEFAESVVRGLSGSGAIVLVNDRFDIALAAGAQGVHLTSNSIPVDLVRREVGDEMVLGISTHSEVELMDARERSADYAFYGPVFETPSKTAYGEPKGLDELAAACEAASPMPVLALGGIDASNFAGVLDAGASGFGAIRAMSDPRFLERLRLIGKGK